MIEAMLYYIRWFLVFLLLGFNIFIWSEVWESFQPDLEKIQLKPAVLSVQTENLTPQSAQVVENIPNQNSSISNQNQSANLAEVVKKALEGSKGDYAIVIKNFKTGEEYRQNENKSYEPASLYKLWVMATVYKQLKEGLINHEDVLSSSIPVLNRKFGISDQNAELTSGYIDMSVDEAVNQMITISHNYAALLLADKIKNSNVTNFLAEYRLNNSSLGEPPKTTASDIALFFDKLYKGQLIDETSSKQMIEVLKKQQLNDGLPKNLNGVQIAHKTGEIEWYKHDAGIVFSNKGDYLIVMLSESESPIGAQGRIADVSKAVYDYFNK